MVPLIRTDVNPADFFTKPMSADKFFKFRNYIMNINPRTALAATCAAVVRAARNSSVLSATALPFSPSTPRNIDAPWGETLD